MKYFYFLLVIILILPILISCGDYYELSPKDKTDTEWETDGDTEYVVNTASYTYHLSSCYIVKSIKDENKVVSTDINFIIERQYTPCKRCINE